MKTHHFCYFKSILLSILLILISNNIIFGQAVNDYKHEFKLGYGVLSIPEMGIGFGLAVVSGIFRLNDKINLNGTLQVGYNRFVRPKLSLGIQASYTSISVKEGRTGNTVHHGFPALYGRFDIHYVNKPRFQMYSGLMGGGMYDIKYDNLSWVAHINFLGFRFGKSHAFYTELGSGFSSTLTVGYSAKF